METVWITDADEKSRVLRDVLAELGDWFGNPEGVAEYAGGVRSRPFLAAIDGGEYLGFFSLETHYGHTGEIYVCGVRPAYRGKGTGRALWLKSEEWFRENRCRYVVAKTLSDEADYPPYEATRAFYRAMGFEPLLTLHEIWDEENPCLIMIKAL